MHFTTTILSVLLGVAACAADDTVLWWAVPENLLIQSAVNPTFSYTLAERGVDSARIRATTDPDMAGMYLTFYAEDMMTGKLSPSTTTVAAVPTLDAFYTSLGVSAQPGYWFIVELGAWTDSGFQMLGSSEAISYETLEKGGFLTTSNPSVVNGSSANIWSVTKASTVPEPSGCLMWFLGGALLTLRRRRMVARHAVSVSKL